MPSSAPSIGHKRSRPSLHVPEEADHPPSVLATEGGTTPLSSVKRRKLNSDTVSESKPNALSTISRTLNKVFSLGRRAESNGANDLKPKGTEDIFDVELSEDDEVPSPQPKSAKARSGSGRSKPNQVLSSKSASAKNPTASATTTGSIEVAPKRGRGRPRKSDVLRREKNLSRKATRTRLAGGDSDEDDALGADGVVQLEDGTPTKRKISRKAVSIQNDGLEMEDHETIDQSSRSRQLSWKAREMSDGTAPIPLKGILTPKKTRTIKSVKSVVFDNPITEEDLGFRDIPNNISPALDGKVHPAGGYTTKHLNGNSDKLHITEMEVEREGEEEGEESGSDGTEIACIICEDPTSEEPNEILLCDKCDVAVHQDCYGVPVIPDGDWLCNDCASAEMKAGLQIYREKDADLAETVVPSHLSHIEDLEHHLRFVQRHVLDQLTGQTPVKLCGHDEEMQKVHQLVEQTVLAGESNSMLIIGARGSGKTTLIEAVISDLFIHRNDFHVVRLNGFIHTDDKLALREIWRQLGREMEVEDDAIGKTNNYADTLASLLALLSHPSEISEADAGTTTKSVIFILDEFDLFTSHPRQTLLYNLFDIAQARKAPIAVIGVTARIDVVESLEKRVKSRFSHRYVHLSLPKSPPAFWEICKGSLLLNEDSIPNARSGKAGENEFLSYWKSMINDLYDDDNFKSLLESNFYRWKSIPAFFTSCIIPITKLSPTSLPLTGQSFISSISLSAPDSKLKILSGLSDLELALLIAAARLDIILDTDACNFAMAYDEYCNLTSRHKVQTLSSGVSALGASAKVLGREVAIGAWERLVDYELLVPTGIGAGGSIAKDVAAGGRMWKVDVALEEIPGSLRLNSVMAKWCKEI